MLRLKIKVIPLLTCLLLVQSCDDVLDGAKKDEERLENLENQRFVPPALPAHVTAMDLSDEASIRQRAAEISSVHDVTIVDCTLVGGRLNLSARHGEVEAGYTLDLSKKAQDLFEETRGIKDPRLNVFYKEFLLSVWKSQTTS